MLLALDLFHTTTIFYSKKILYPPNSNLVLLQISEYGVKFFNGRSGVEGERKYGCLYAYKCAEREEI